MKSSLTSAQVIARSHLVGSNHRIRLSFFPFPALRLRFLRHTVAHGLLPSAFAVSPARTAEA